MSLTLAATDTITGVAGSATSITYTIFGDEVAAGADAFKVLAQGQLPSPVGPLYTVPASTVAIVKAIHLVNGTAGSVTARLNVKGTAAANAILPAITILAGGFAVYADDGWKVYNDQGQVLGVGATGATGAAGAAGAAGANGLATSGTPAVVLSTTAAAGVAATALATDAQIIAFDATVPSTQAFGDAAATGSAAVTARRDHKHAMPSSPLGLPLGLTGAVSATRYVGGTASVAPTTGTFAIGDFVITHAGSVYICTAAGTPGTWVAVSGGGGGGAPTTAKYVTTAADGTLSAEIVRPQLANYYGETPPTSANATYDDEFDDGSGMSGTVNGLAAKWAWRNQGTSTITYGKQGWGTLNCQAQSSNNHRIIEIAAFADGTYETCLSFEAPYVAGGGVQGAGGIVLVDAVNGDFYFFSRLIDSGTQYIALQRWSNITTWSANDLLISPALFLTRFYVRVTKAGTALEFWTSTDGIGYIRAIAFTDVIIATRIGLAVNETNNTGLVKLHIDYFRKVA